MTHTISSIAEDSRLHNETNDCTVRAITATTGLPYATCHEALRRRGRKNRCGAYNRQWRAAVEDLGFELVDMTELFRKRGARTVRTAQRFLPRGRKFILWVKGHVAGWNGEQLLDWSDGRLHRIKAVFEVVAKESGPTEPATGETMTVVLNKKRAPNVFANMARTRNKTVRHVTAPPRVNRAKWVAEQLPNMPRDEFWVLELVGDAAVAERKRTGLKGSVYTIFWTY